VCTASVGDRGGICGMGDLAFVGPGASYAVDSQSAGLWILPDLCKTHRTRFAQVLGRR